MKKKDYITDNTDVFIQQLISLGRETTQIITNIIGIQLDNHQEPIQMGCFEIGHSHDINNQINQAGNSPKVFFQNKKNYIYQSKYFLFRY